MDFFATAAKGTEGVLRDELRELGFDAVRADRGGVHFRGALAEGYRACLWSRVAVRVLTPVARFECPNEDALYEGVRSHDFSDVLSTDHTFAVSAACRSSHLTHTQYIAQRTKDAIVDPLRERFGARPNVDRDDPDVHVFVHLAHDVATVYLDLAGEPLHMRGYRKVAGTAPLKENLAAAVLRMAGYRGEGAFADPMCGSGTLIIEAALAAERRAPGLLRSRFGFERWRNFGDAERRAMQELRAQAREQIRPATARIVGSDASPEAVAAARSNAESAGVHVELAVARLRTAEPHEASGVLATNPPYGERLAQASDLPRELARLIDRFYRWHAALLMKSDAPLARTRRKPRLFTVYNGDIECSVRCYQPVPVRSTESD